MKLRCKKCNDIIEGDKKGTYITCKCKAIAIDETPYYWRIIGNIENFEEIIDKRICAETLLEKEYKEYPKEEAKFNKYCTRFFQKRIRNVDGDTQYFINVYEYAPHREEDKENYEIELQFEKEKYNLNITMFGIDENMTVEQMESEVYAMWYGLDCKYYDKN